MAFVEGQGVFGKITFVDGTEPPYNRPYLIVNVYADHIEVLNVSSVRGKEKKLAFSTNERLHVFHPPFIKPSFVKLDSLTKVSRSDWSKLVLLDNGNTLDAAELNRIKTKLYHFYIDSSSGKSEMCISKTSTNSPQKGACKK